MKPIIEGISGLDQKKVHLENLIKDLHTGSDKLGYVAKANKFETTTTTLKKTRVKIRCRSKTERIRFLYQEKTETRKNEKQKVNLILNIVLFYKPIFFEKHWIMFTIC